MGLAIRRASLLTLFVLAWMPAPGRAACNKDLLCAPAASPCTINGTNTIDDGCVLDYSGRVVVLNGNLDAVTLPSGDGGSFTVLAGTLTMNGGSLVSTGANATGGSGGSITVTTSGAFTMQGYGVRINTNGDGGGGSVTVNASTISVLAGSPAISADGTATEGDGGDIELTAGGAVQLVGRITATGGSASDGGSVSLTGATVAVDKSIDVSGGNFVTFEDINLTSTAGDITIGSTGRLVGNGGTNDYSGGDGADFVLAAAGNLVINGGLTANGADDGDGGTMDLSADDAITIADGLLTQSGTSGGDGGSIGAMAGTDVTVQASIQAEGRGGGDGGSITLDAGNNLDVQVTVSATSSGEDTTGGTIAFNAGDNLTVQALVSTSASGAGASGGTITFYAEGDLQTSSIIESLSGSNGSGGKIDYFARGNTTMTNTSNWRVDGARTGGAIARIFAGLRSPGAMTVDGSLRARGTASGGTGGTINLGPHCAITVNGPADLLATGDGSAADGAISLTAGSITVSPSANVAPGASQSIIPPDQLPCCGNGGLNSGEACDDGNVFNCDGCSANCTVEPHPVCADDGNPCTAEACDAQLGCTETPLTGTACPSDGDACTADICQAGVCTHPASTCNDGVACTVDSCMPGVGCVALPNDALCDDGNNCTTDVCSATAGCSSTVLPDGSACTDGSVCTTDDRCQSGSCVPMGSALNCNDGNACTVDSCNPAVGCLDIESAALCPCNSGGSPLPPGTPCADGSPCTVGEVCDGGGTCSGGGPRNCDDGNPCTADACFFGLCVSADNQCATTCTGQPNGTPCSDGSPCTTGMCQGGACVSSSIACDDGDPCNGVEICVSAPALGCRASFPVDGTTCNDGSACTQADACHAGACTGTPLVCAPLDQCHDAGTCSPTTGVCSNPTAPDGTPCDDGDLCTIGDACQSGACANGGPLLCAPCEVCDPLSGGCLVAPKAGCREPTRDRKSQILILDSPVDAADKIFWKWLSGQATAAADFGNPPGGDDYTLCVYENTGPSMQLLYRLAAPGGGACGSSGAPCWTPLGNPLGAKGFRYKDVDRTPDGIATIILTPGADGHAKIILKGKGDQLPIVSPLAVEVPVRVQLQAENGKCWEANYPQSGVRLDDQSVFKAKGGAP